MQLEQQHQLALVQLLQGLENLQASGPSAVDTSPLMERFAEAAGAAVRTAWEHTRDTA